MSVPDASAYAQDTVERELAELRSTQLLQLTAAYGAAGLIYLIATFVPGRIDGMPVLVILGMMGWLAFRLRRRHPRLAAWGVLLGMDAAIALIMIVRPSSLITGLGTLVVIAATTLLSFRETLAVTGLTWLTTTLVWLSLPGVPARAGSPLETLALYALALIFMRIGLDYPRKAMGWALTAWRQAHDALLAVRERRAEILSVARSLEEALCRIERMNNELIVARREAESARANKARFAAMVSHELRGPLNLILGFSKLMTLSPRRYGAPLPPAYRADLDTIYVNSQHLSSLIDDILDLSQIDATELPLMKERVVLTDIVAEVVEIVRSLAERKGIYLRTELPSDMPALFVDRVRMRQILINLLTNAVRFTEEGGIIVRCILQGDEVLVSVQDTGRGIAPEDMPKLFQEFSQVQVAESSSEKSTGLGLVVSKHLIELHGGRIWAESALGRGTTFHFTLPLRGEAPHPAPVRREGGERALRPYGSCLVAHDDPAVVRLLARHIKSHQVIGLPDERQVLAMVQELHPRAIITTPERLADIQEQLRPVPLDVPVISCPIGTISRPHAEQGAFAYLIKPVSSEVLEATLRRLGLGAEATVLIIDDEPDAVRLLEIMLTALPGVYRVLKARDGLQGLQMMQEAAPDLVLLDLMIPGLTGEELMARMQGDRRLCNVPVIVISAKDPLDYRVTLSMPLTVWGKEALDISEGIKLVNALLGALGPHYLTEPVPAQAPARGPLA